MEELLKKFAVGKRPPLPNEADVKTMSEAIDRIIDKAVITREDVALINKTAVVVRNARDGEARYRGDPTVPDLVKQYVAKVRLHFLRNNSDGLDRLFVFLNTKEKLLE